MSLSSQDLLFLVVLSSERISPKNGIDMAKSSWQYFLAEVRTQFIYDELIKENGLGEGKDGYVLEIDNGISKLTDVFNKYELKAHRKSTQEITSLQTADEYSLGISHNQLEHLETLDKVETMLNQLAKHSLYGMVHQVHAVDDPAFEWDRTHTIRLTGNEWEYFFRSWAEKHHDEGWTYLGNHRGASGRPLNHVLERNGNLPYYTHYDKTLIRQFISEFTFANGITIARLPLLLASFAIAKDDPYLLAGLLGVVHGLDAVDGLIARQGFGNSRYGPILDITIDHLIELYTAFEYAYNFGVIPKSYPWVLTIRNLSVDFLRFYNGVTKSFSSGDAHPHKAFGTQKENSKKARLTYGLRKALGDITIPIIPSLGYVISSAHVLESLVRAEPVLNSTRAKEITIEILNKIKTASNKNC